MTVIIYNRHFCRMLMIELFGRRCLQQKIDVIKIFFPRFFPLISDQKANRKKHNIHFSCLSKITFSCFSLSQTLQILLYRLYKFSTIDTNLLKHNIFNTYYFISTLLLYTVKDTIFYKSMHTYVLVSSFPIYYGSLSHYIT